MTVQWTDGEPPQSILRTAIDMENACARIEGVLKAVGVNIMLKSVDYSYIEFPDGAVYSGPLVYLEADGISYQRG